MSKKILKLEKETSSWKQRWENSHAALLEMAADKQQRDAELAKTSRKLAQLQQLCRALQGERASLLAQLRGKDGAPVPEEAVTVEEVVTEENIKSIKQVDDLSKDCQALKENLVQLQGSLAEAIKKEEEEKIQKEEELRSEKLAEKTEKRNEAGQPQERLENGTGNDAGEIICSEIDTQTEIIDKVEKNGVNDDTTDNNIEESQPLGDDDDKSGESVSPGTKKGKV